MLWGFLAFVAFELQARISSPSNLENQFVNQETAGRLTAKK